MIAPLLTFLAGFAGGAVVATGLRKLGMDRGDVLRTLLGVLILALFAYSAIGTYQGAADLARTADCQQRQNAQFAAALTARADATTRGNDAQREFLAAVADPAVSPEVEAQAFAEYLAALDDIDAARDRNPLTTVECR